MAGLRRTAWLEIDLEALRQNLSVIAELVGPAVVAPVVKANAYGHGIEVVGPLLADVSDALCVATLDEALALRASGVGGRVIVLYAVPAPGIDAALEGDIELTLMSATDASELLARASRGAGTARAHLALETGMARGGLDAEAALAAARALHQRSDIRLVGLWTHLAAASDPDASAAQVARFERVVASIRHAGLDVPARHIASSEGIFTGAAPTYELVRPGLAIYGLLDASLDVPAHARAAAGRLRPAMALKARAVAFSDVPVGGGVGYGGLWHAARPSRVAVLPIGYADGYARPTQPGAEVLVQGRRVAVVGAISMDAIAVDVTELPGLSYADEFVLMGSQGDLEISAAELARQRNTIVWEVLSGMAARLPRVYNPSAGSAEGT